LEEKEEKKLQKFLANLKKSENELKMLRNLGIREALSMNFGARNTN
jgi:hypothetical protein